MDDIARYNRARWRSLVDANAVFTRPALDLDPESARRRLDPSGRLGAVEGRRVLVLAGGGGQQSVAFALLGAHVTVLDLSDAQLSHDRAAAAQLGLEIQAVEGDMRDLTMFDEASFDVVSQPYSLNFVPDCRTVFREVARIVRRGGLYSVDVATPYVVGVGERDFDGEGYVVKLPYVQGALLEHRIRRGSRADVASSRHASTGRPSRPSSTASSTPDSGSRISTRACTPIPIHKRHRAAGIISTRSFRRG